MNNNFDDILSQVNQLQNESEEPDNNNQATPQKFSKLKSLIKFYFTWLHIPVCNFTATIFLYYVLNLAASYFNLKHVSLWTSAILYLFWEVMVINKFRNLLKIRQNEK